MTTVVITGFMGTGKSSVGRALAERLGVPFLDTDAMVERREGRAVRDIFAADGESYFRCAEKRAVAEALQRGDAVVATGGGAVLDRDNLTRMRRAGRLVCLTASPAAIEGRIRAQGATRPLLADPDPRARIEALLAERAEAYAEADVQIDTTNRDLDDLVEEIMAFLGTTND